MSSNTISKDYEIVKTERFRVRVIFSIFPFIVANGFESDFHWTGKWFSFVSIREQFVKERCADFDSGWTFNWYWCEWKESWKLFEILK
ncbi:MAG: hypothetical protein WC979_02285 [Candidatus Pacearchaeota archaeon]|jgi:hypothetical protein|nr:hypothetical protein [Clostridia bacterium]